MRVRREIGRGCTIAPMTTFDTGGPDYGALDETPPRMSGLAIAALVCSLIFCIPVFPPLGLLLGLIALVAMVGKTHVKGRGMAIAAIVLGICFTAGWSIGGYFLYDFGRQVYAVMKDAPQNALTAGSTGDIAGFRSAFDERNSTATDDDAKAFFAELERRYGTFQTIRFNEASAPPPGGQQPTITMPYKADFSNATGVMMEIEIVIADPKTGEWVKKLGSINVNDPQQPTLRYPPLPPAPTGIPPKILNPPTDPPTDSATPGDGAATDPEAESGS